MDNEKNPIDLLLLSLKMLNLLPKSGNGRIEMIFQDGFLLDTTSTNRIRVKQKIEDSLKSSLSIQTD